jgi:hypothetical protein
LFHSPLLNERNQLGGAATTIFWTTRFVAKSDLTPFFCDLAGGPAGAGGRMIEADGSQLGDARELQPLATATPEQAGMSGERLSRISTMLKKEIPA